MNAPQMPRKTGTETSCETIFKKMASGMKASSTRINTSIPLNKTMLRYIASAEKV